MSEFQGGAYIDPARRAVVRKLIARGIRLFDAPSPPYFRLSLGARVMHEWGHIAHAAKFLRVPDENKLAYKEARSGLGDCLLKRTRSDASNSALNGSGDGRSVTMLDPPSSHPRA